MLRFLACAMLLSLVACLPEPPQTSEDAEAWQAVGFVCEDKTIEAASPQHAVYVQLNDSKVKIADLAICDTVTSADYGQWGIPEHAITAVGGWWAGFGDFVYAAVEEEELHFYVGGVSEGGDEPTLPQYHLLASYSKGKFNLLRPTSAADLAGYYLNQQTDSSYVLFVGLKGPYLISKLFATADPLPPGKVLQRALPQFATSPEQDFICSLNTLEFYSGLGAGYLRWRPDSAQLVFQEFIGQQGEFVFTQMQH